MRRPLFMIISKDEKARLWKKNGGRCGKCFKPLNPFNEVVFHVHNSRNIGMYCTECETAIAGGNMNNESLLCKDNELLLG
jgi:hypothetical protein